MKYKHSRTHCQLKYSFAKTISSSSLWAPLSVTTWAHRPRS